MSVSFSIGMLLDLFQCCRSGELLSLEAWQVNDGISWGDAWQNFSDFAQSSHCITEYRRRIQLLRAGCESYIYILYTRIWKKQIF